MEQKIPKVIHYIWLGGAAKSELMNRCIESWKRLCPDYEIIEWNEQNLDLSEPWVKEAVEQKNWAFASDILRARILYKHGGIYLDTDVEILKPLNRFLEHEFFMGCESDRWCCGAVIGSVKKHPIIQKYLSRFDAPYKKIGLSNNLFAVHSYNAAIKILYNIEPKGATVIKNGVAMYARDWFFPQHYLTHKTQITENSHTIHHYASTWLTPEIKRKFKFLRFLRKAVGKRIYGFFEGLTAKEIRHKLIKEMGAA